MKNHITFILLSTLTACTNNPDPSALSNSYLRRIDSLIEVKDNDLSIELDRAYASNPAIASSVHRKAFNINQMVKEFQQIISSDSILSKNKITVNDLITATYSEIDKFKLDPIFIEKLKVRYLQHWISRNLAPPFNKEDAQSLLIDFKLFHYEIKDYLYSQINANDFNFNVLKPLILEKSNFVSAGETYEAKIGLIPIDTTRYPEIKVGEFNLEFVDGFGIYRSHIMTKGKKTIKGYIVFQRNNNRLDTIPFEHSYFVQ
jgi:hypothetical protein